MVVNNWLQAIILLYSQFVNDALRREGAFILLGTMTIDYDIMYPKITSKPCQTGDTDHDCHKIKNRT